MKGMSLATALLPILIVGGALACGMPPAEKEEPLPPSDPVFQKQTVADIRNTGTALFSWLTDQVGAAAAGQSQVPDPVDLAGYSRISHADLISLLVPDYMPAVAEVDGWKFPYEYYVNVADPRAEKVVGIRSPGRDGTFSGNVYTATRFEPTSFDEDLVWADGYFIRWPQQ